MTDQELKLLNDWSAASLTIDTTEYPMLQAFTPDRKPILTIHHDGRIEVSEDAKPTETAKLVLEAMQGMVQMMLTQEWNRAIDAALNSYSPDDTAGYYLGKVEDLKK